MAQLVIDYIRKEQGINLDTLVDKDFSQLNWLIEVEPTKDIKGQRVSKSYYAYPNLGIKVKTKYIIKGKETESGLKEAIRITYHKMYETVNDIDNVFVGFYKNIHWIDWAGNIGATKSEKPYYFTLEPVFVGDGTETIVGYSSPKMRAILREERYSSNDYYTYEIEEVVINKEALRLQYSEMISNIQGMREAIERNIIDGTEIPLSLLEERCRLKEEYNRKINKIN